jgi:hypothetical protein
MSLSGHSSASLSTPSLIHSTLTDSNFAC